MKSLRFRGHKSRFDEIVETLDDTCTWLFENSKYKEWFQQRTGLLRLTGYRTSGKSTLMKRAVQNMDSHAGLVMSHFFNRRCRQGAELQKNACGFFRSLMYQFLPYSHSSLCEAMLKYEETSDDSLWGQQWLKDTLKEEIPKACKKLPMVILVDAIDECSPEGPASIMDFLQTVLSKSSGGELRICVSYSPGDVTEEADIDMAHHNYGDIAKFVQEKLSGLRKCKLSVSPESERSITMEIQERAQGMFLWAEIACDKVIEMDGHEKSAQAILSAIEFLPQRIDDMFLDLLKEVQRNDAKETIKLFRWICFAKRPLSVEELQYAIVMDPDMKETSIREICKNPDFRKDQRDMIRAIFHLSRGLAKVVNRKSSFEVKRVNADEQDDDGRTPLWYAVAAEQTAAAELLLKINSVNPNTEDKLGSSPFRIAASRGCGELMEALFKLSEGKLQVTAALLIDAARNLRHGADVLKILLNKKLPEVKMTEETIYAAAANHESGLKVISILIQDERLEMGNSERILEGIPEFFDMDTTRLFLQKRCSGTQVSENMIVAAARNLSSGAAITNFLLASGSTIPIMEKMMESAATNAKQGPEVMKVFLRSSQPTETISTRVLYSATNYWREGEEVMRMLLRDERTEEIPRRVLDAAARNRYGGEMIKAFFMERRSEFLRQVRHTLCRNLAEEIAEFNIYGAEVMQLLLQMVYQNIRITPRLMDIVTEDRHGANLMMVLVRKRTIEVLRLLTESLKLKARVNWGSDVAEEVFSQGRNIELSWGLGVSEDRYSVEFSANRNRDRSLRPYRPRLLRRVRSISPPF